MPRRLFALLAVLGAGCVSQSSLDGFPLPAEARQPGATFAVRHQPQDQRGLDALIAQTLRARGLQVVPEDAHPDYVVSYLDRWQWDMRMYLIDLRIDVRDADTNVLVATGRSYQTSLSAMGETHRSIVERTVGVLLGGRDAGLSPPPGRAWERIGPHRGFSPGPRSSVSAPLHLGPSSRSQGRPGCVPSSTTC
jgi:hypothetical protein